MGTHRGNATAPWRTVARAELIFHGLRYLALNPGWWSLSLRDCSRAPPRRANRTRQPGFHRSADRSESSSSYRNQWAATFPPNGTYSAVVALGQHGLSGANKAHLSTSNPHVEMRTLRITRSTLVHAHPVRRLRGRAVVYGMSPIDDCPAPRWPVAWGRIDSARSVEGQPGPSVFSPEDV